MKELFLHLLNMSITAGYIAIAVIILRAVFNKVPKWIICLLWAFVGIRLLLPISFESKASLLPSTKTVPSDIMYTPTPSIHSGTYMNHIVNPIIEKELAPKPSSVVTPIESITSVASQIWLCGVILMLLYFAFSYLKIRIRVRESVKLDKRVWQSDRIPSPFILGLLMPRIYIPSTVSEGDIKYIIAHENAHIKRLDHIWKPLAFILLSVYWFNPVLWAAYILLCRDIELACDERVLKKLGEDIKVPYSRALINCSEKQRIISACPLAFGETSVKERVRGILNYKKPAFWIIIISLVICIALAVGFLTNPKEKEKERVGEETYQSTEKVPSYTPIVLGEDKCYVFYPKELVYSGGVFSYVQTVESAPDYRLLGDMRFFELSSRTVTLLGEMQEITLNESNFDVLFDSMGAEKAKELRQNNRRAFELRIDMDFSDDKLYILLEQNDGTYYVGEGYYNFGDNNRSLIRWLYLTSRSRQTYVSGIPEEMSYRQYSYASDLEMADPSFSLYNDGRFSFTYSLFSSYFATGEYTDTGSEIIMNTSDGNNTYVFVPSGNGYVFDASRSSAIPSYRYSSGAEPQCPVPDGAFFEFKGFKKSFNPIYDHAVYDIDGDGVDEWLTLSVGPTSGRFTFRFEVSEESGENTVNVFSADGWSSFSFKEKEDGKVYLCAVLENGEEIYYSLGIKDGSITLNEIAGKKYLLNVSTEGVAEFLKNNTEYNPKENGNWYNVTPERVKNELGVNIFLNDMHYYSMIEVEGEIYNLCTGFGGIGFMSGVPCDFNNDGELDLLFTYSWGSGIHRTEIGLFDIRTRESMVIESRNEENLIRFMNIDVAVDEHDGEYILYSVEHDEEDMNFAICYKRLIPIGKVKCDEKGPYIE